MTGARSLTNAVAHHLTSTAHDSQMRLVAARAVVLREVVVTGIGVILPNCDTRQRFWEQLLTGKTQLMIEPDPADGMPCAVGRVRDFDARKYLAEIPESLYGSCHREQQFYVASVAQACKDAGFELREMASPRVGLFDGTSRGSFGYWYELLQRKLAEPGARFSLRDLSPTMPGQAVGLAAAMLGVKGPTYTFSGTCASGAVAFGAAFRELQLGRVDVALATGHDAALIAPLFQMYRDAGLLSQEHEDPARAIRPYTEHGANAFGEGAVTLVLETREHAEARGASILAVVAGYRHGNGGEHPTDVDFTGQRPAQLIEDVLDEAEMPAAEVNFVVGHGNGVSASDISELNYMKRVFGRRTRDVPLISTKPIYGHTLGASSALNLAAATLMLHQGLVIPTVGADPRRTVHGFSHQAKPGSVRLSNGVAMSYGIGGQHAAVALRRHDP